MSTIEETVAAAVESRSQKIVQTLCDLVRYPSIVKADPPPREAALPAKVPLPPPRAPRIANSAEIPLPPPRPMRSGAASPPARNAPDGQSASTVPPSPEIEHRSVSPYGELVPVTPVE